MKRMKALIAPEASEPALVGLGDATAIQALANGVANADQQKRALKWILESACALPVWAFRSDVRQTDLALGRQFVAQQIVGAIQMNVSRLRKLEETNNG